MKTTLILACAGKGSRVGLNKNKLLVKVKIESGDGSLVFKDFKLSEIKVKRANRIEDEDTSKEEREMKDLLD